MRNLTIALLLCVLTVSITKATVIFDPETYPADSLKEGMEVVDVDGVKMMKITVDAWSTTFNLAADVVIPANENKIRFMTKYDADTTSFTVDQVKTFVKLTGVGDPVELAMNPSSADVVTFVGDAGEITVKNIQVAGQETVTWSAVKGSIIYVGKMTAYEADPSVLFDPAQYDGALPAGMEIVEEGGVSLLKVTLDEWNQTLDIVPFDMGVNNQVNYKAKLEPGTSGFTLDKINSFVKGTTADASEVWANGAASTADLSDYSANAKKGVIVAQLQFAGQETETWSAITGAILYVSKITVEEKKDEYADPRVTLSVLHTGGENIKLDGIMAEDIWIEAKEGKADQVALGGDTGDPKSDNDNSGFFYAIYDANYLYIFTEIVDDVVMPIGASDQYWMNDGVEIFIDIMDRRIVGKRINSEQHQLRFNVDRAEADTSALGGYIADWGGIKGSTGYSFEIALPWEGICKGAVADGDIDKYVKDEIKGGKNIAFEISVIDADKLDGRKSILNWANNTGTDQAYTNSQYYGQLTLATGGTPINKYTLSNDVKVYPNPASGILNVELEGMTSLELVDISGRTILQKELDADATQLNVEALNSGIYLLKVESSLGSAVRKVQIN